MESVLRAAAVYVILMVLMRIAGRRTLSEVTTFDFVLLLIIGETTQQAILGDDFSVTGAVIVLLTLIVMEFAMSLIQTRFPGFGRLVNGVPIVILEDGKPINSLMRRAGLDADDILEEARKEHGIERLDQIKYAVLERSGGISIIPARDAGQG